jgi:hypothetical protein
MKPQHGSTPSSALHALAALGLLLSHHETGCPRAAHRAADMLARLADAPGMDAELRVLCERASTRLASEGARHVSA